jgi:hypothetical protein
VNSGVLLSRENLAKLQLNPEAMELYKKLTEKFK